MNKNGNSARARISPIQTVSSKKGNVRSMPAFKAMIAVSAEKTANARIEEREHTLKKKQELPSRKLPPSEEDAHNCGSDGQIESTAHTCQKGGKLFD
jgi:hypothetical protein